MPINESSSSFAATDAGIQQKINKNKNKKMHGSGTTTLITSNEEINDITKTVKTLENSNILLKGIHKQIKNETKEQKRGFLGMLLRTLRPS